VHQSARTIVVLNVVQNLLRWLTRKSGEHSHPEMSEILRVLRHRSFPSSRFTSLLQYEPKNWSYFFEALLHRSYLQYLSLRVNSNERLEFLGDAILNFIVADYLWAHYPELEEGNLTKFRSRLVNRKILAQRAKELSLDDFLFLSASALQSLDTGSDSILADAFEAIVGALYLDGGIPAARRFVERTLLSNVDIEALMTADDNYKSALLEYAQAQALGIPRYAMVKEEGPDHDRRFTIEVFVGNERYGVGSGRSKKDAEQAAALMALERIQSTQPHENENKTPDSSSA
jgi:ribonuclease-3